jgi:nitroimidazol reductase NimA-like FMN-containing flavoprotein (pyridoxamine 5'-phosphate oxidase superfamily)
VIGALTLAEIEEVLQTQYIGRLGVTGEGRIYIFPVAYGYDGAFIYVHSHVGRYGGQKVQLMRATPQVCFEVEEISSPVQWRTVLVHGTFEELTQGAAREIAMAAILAQGDQPHPLSVAPYVGTPEEIVVYRIRPSDKTGHYERDEVFPQRAAQ